MPHLGNVVYLLGAGPLTLHDTYLGLTPFPHQLRWLGYPLTLVSAGCGAVMGVWIFRAARSVVDLVRSPWPVEAAGDGAVQRMRRCFA